MRGPKPVYQPSFTEEQVECARTLVRRHKTPQAKAKRAQLVLLSNEHPDIDCVSAARKLGMHEQSVRRWRRRWTKEGFSLDDKPRYMAAWDVFRGKVYGDCVPSVTKPVFHRLVGQVMSEKIYKRTHRVFWILDNSTCHRTDKQTMELERLYPNMIVVNLPRHASWLNQDEICFSICTSTSGHWSRWPDTLSGLMKRSTRSRRWEFR